MNIVLPIARQALAQPEQLALVSRRGGLTYAQLVARVMKIAATLRQAGVKPTDIVGIAVEGSTVHVTATLAVAWVGAVSVTLPARGRQGPTFDVSAVLHNVDVEPGLGGAECLVDLRDIASQASSAAATDCEMVDADHPWRISFSSGTTGAPKPVGCTHGEQMLRTHLAGVVYPCVSGQRVLIGMGIGLSFALHYWLRTLSYGGTVVCVPGATAELLDAAHRDQPNMIVTSAGMAMALAQLARQADGDRAKPPASLERLVIGGGHLSPQVRELLQRHVCPRLGINYGSSEAGLIAVADPGLQAQDPRCDGRLLPWVEAQAVDADGNPLPPGKVGVLRLRSPTINSRYQPPGAPAGAVTTADGWYNMGDRGSVLPDGRVYLRPRTDVLNLGGRKIEASGIEAVVLQNPDVLECVVLTTPRPAGDAMLVAVVVARSEVDVPALQNRCREALGEPWVPRRVVRVADLPRNDGGKVMRDAVARGLRWRKGGAAAEVQDGGTGQ